MPHFIFLKPFIHIYLLFFCLAASFINPEFSPAAAAGSAGMDEGYSARVLEKVLKEFNPVNELSSGTTLSALLFIDADGRFTDCRIRTSSGTQSMDKTFCSAVRKASPFGIPPYSQPSEVFITFINAKNPDTLPVSKKQEQAKPAVTKTASTDSPEKQKYITAITRNIRQSVYIPAEAKKGTYHPVARVKLDRQGKIISSEIIKSSGDKTIDKYLLQGIKRAGKTTPPPNGLGNEFDLGFQLIR